MICDLQDTIHDWREDPSSKEGSRKRMVCNRCGVVGEVVSEDFLNIVEGSDYLSKYCREVQKVRVDILIGADVGMSEGDEYEVVDGPDSNGNVWINSSGVKIRLLSKEYSYV